MDARLPWHRRLGIRVHLVYCVWCRRYASQLWFLRAAARELGAKQPEARDQELSPEAKEHVRARLREAMERLPRSPR